MQASHMLGHLKSIKKTRYKVICKWTLIKFISLVQLPPACVCGKVAGAGTEAQERQWAGCQYLKFSPLLSS